MKNSYKIGKKEKKNRGLLVMMFRGFRVQCAFPNMESIAMLNENSYKIGGKREKNRGLLVMMWGGSGSSVHFQIWKVLLC